MYYKSDMLVLSPNNNCPEKAISIIYSECEFVALVIQDAKRMRRITRYWWRVRSDAFFHIIS